jgi:hypothetical protein
MWQTTFLTSSSYSVATGTIPASYTSDISSQQICPYVSYPVHVDGTIQKIVGSVSGSSPFDFYIMSQAQYKDFVNGNPPCESSYTAITLGYLRNEFNIDWTPSPGDYQILLQNIASYPITYTIQIFAVHNSSSMVYSTMQVIHVVTSTLRQTSITVQSFPAATSNGTRIIPTVQTEQIGLSFGQNNKLVAVIGVVVATMVAILAYSFVRKRRR